MGWTTCADCSSLGLDTCVGLLGEPHDSKCSSCGGPWPLRVLDNVIDTTRSALIESLTQETWPLFSEQLSVLRELIRINDNIGAIEVGSNLMFALLETGDGSMGPHIDLICNAITNHDTDAIDQVRRMLVIRYTL